MSALDDIVDRAIDFTNRILQTMPSYREASVKGLHKLRHSLGAKSPGDPAIKRLDDYLDALSGQEAAGGLRSFDDPLTKGRTLR